jgi:hypothetical protein
MIAAIWLALRTSPLAIGALALLLSYGGFKGYGKYQHYAGVKAGEARLADKIEKKANEDAKVADAAAEGVATGRPGRPDPYRMRK